jgi:hypothetical protein
MTAYDRALELTTNPAEHRFLTEQRATAAARAGEEPETR